MTGWQAVTDAVCRVATAAYTPLRRRREQALRSQPDLRNILVLNEVRGVGNMVLLSGLLLNLRRLYPHARLTVAMPASPVARFLIGPVLADDIFFFDPSGGRRALLSFAWTVLRPRRFDLGLATFFSPTLLTSCVLALAGCHYRIAYAQSANRGVFNTMTLVSTGGHELDGHLRLIEFTGRRLERKTALSVPALAMREAAALTTQSGLGIERPLLGIHPGCDRVNLLKRWPVERFVRVIDRVVRDGLADVVIFLGPDDMDLHRSLSVCVGPRVQLCSESFDRVAAMIGQCQAFLSNDSGLMHVAAALGVPVVAIFGPTDTIKNAPLGSAVTFITTDVPCRPCYVGPPATCHRDRQYCFEDIQTDRVVHALQGALASTRPSTPTQHQDFALRVAANGA